MSAQGKHGSDVQRPRRGEVWRVRGSGSPTVRVESEPLMSAYGVSFVWCVTIKPRRNLNAKPCEIRDFLVRVITEEISP